MSLDLAIDDTFTLRHSGPNTIYVTGYSGELEADKADDDDDEDDDDEDDVRPHPRRSAPGLRLRLPRAQGRLGVGPDTRRGGRRCCAG